ncbi:Uncharacterised protein [Escherichia coli]|uniref:Uncharacterized protein n=1 Tax=Escherichia coli TaxID=562 RepID=A0A2X1NED8_ECOLX|nr:Uncharacterised protein [Escherichia coli]
MDALYPRKNNEDIARKKEWQNARKADAKLQEGFLRKLGSIIGVRWQSVFQ